MTFDGWPAATASGVNVLLTLIAAWAGADTASASAHAPSSRRSGRGAGCDSAGWTTFGTDLAAERRMATQSGWR